MEGLNEGGREQTEAYLFANTRWSLVLRARDKSAVALGALCESYRKPLIVWLRSRSYTQADAEDLVQGLTAQLLGHNFLENVSPDKGKFRTFLLKCLEHYIADQRDREDAQKRGGGATLESLDDNTENERYFEPASDRPTPDVEYDRAWAGALLENALQRLDQECAQQGHKELFSKLRPVLLSDDSALSYRDIATRLNTSEGAVKVAAHRIRTRLKGLIHEEVMQTVVDETECQEEIRYLIQLLGR